MITEKDLHEAIAECQGERNPNANTCIKLAAFYTILDHITEKQEEPLTGYSYDAEPSGMIQLDSGSEFSRVVNGQRTEDVMAVMDELMETLMIVNPPLYNGVLRKL